MTGAASAAGAPASPMRARMAGAAIVALAALIPVFGGAYLTTVLFTLFYAYIVAQSWDWLHGEAGYVNLGHYIYFGTGAYAFAVANVHGLPVVLCFFVAALFTGLAGAALSLPLFRLRGDFSPSPPWRCCRCSNFWPRTWCRSPAAPTASCCRQQPP